MALSDLGEIDVGIENVILALGCRCQYPAVGTADKRLTGEVEALLSADPVAERGEVAILKGSNSKLGLVEALRPFTNRPRLRHHHQLRSRDGQRSHVLGIVAVVTNGDPHPAHLGVEDWRSGIARSVVALLVEAGKVGDMNHSRPAEQTAVDESLRRFEAASDALCTGCRYCMPCPEAVGISEILRLANASRIYQLTEGSRRDYALFDVDWPYGTFKDASHCTECGACLPKCPQKISIPEQLAKAHELLAKPSAAPPAGKDG